MIIEPTGSAKQPSRLIGPLPQRRQSDGRPGLRSVAAPTAVDIQGLPGDIAGGVAGQVQQRTVELVGPGWATSRRVARRSPVAGRGGLASPQGLPPRPDHAGPVGPGPGGRAGPRSRGNHRLHHRWVAAGPEEATGHRRCRDRPGTGRLVLVPGRHGRLNRPGFGSHQTGVPQPGQVREFAEHPDPGVGHHTGSISRHFDPP